MTNEELDAKLKAHEDRMGKIDAIMGLQANVVQAHELAIAALQAAEAQEPVAIAKRVGGTIAAHPVIAHLFGYLATAALALTIGHGCVPPVVPPVVPVVPPAPPTPTPVTKSKLIVSFIHDATQDTPAWAKVTADFPTRQTLLAAGHKVRVYDITQDEYKTMNFAPFVAKAGGVPAVIIQAPDGTVRAAVKLPADTAGVLKAVTDAGGF